MGVLWAQDSDGIPRLKRPRRRQKGKMTLKDIASSNGAHAPRAAQELIALGKNDGTEAVVIFSRWDESHRTYTTSVVCADGARRRVGQEGQSWSY